MIKTTPKSIFSRSRLSAKKVVSVSAAVAVCLTSALTLKANAETTSPYGYDGLNAKIYTPMDLVPKKDSTDSFNTGSDVWKFGFEKLASSDYDVMTGLEDKDLFRVTTAGFAAPEIKKLSAGTAKISWSATEPAAAVYTVKVLNTVDSTIAEYTAKGTECVLDGLSETGIYNIQVTAGGKASYVAVYSPSNAASSNVKTVNADIKMLKGGDTDQLNDHSTAGIGTGGAYFLIDIKDEGSEILNKNGALLIKVRQDLDESKVTDIYKNDRTTAFSSKDAKIDSNLFFFSVDPNHLYLEYGKSDKVTTGADYMIGSATAKTYFLNSDKTKLAEFSANTSGSVLNYSNSTFKKVGYPTDGYMLISLAMFSDRFFEEVKINNFIRMNTSSYRYTDGAGTCYYDASKEIWNLIDRSLTFEDVQILSDYRSFVIENGLAETEEDGTFAIGAANATPTLESKAYVLGDAAIYTAKGFSSSYNFCYSFFDDNYSHNRYITRSIRYTSKLGEKMMFGFTAPETGIYEIAAPIDSELNVNVDYAVSKVTADGDKVYIQDWNTYTDEDGIIKKFLNKGLDSQFCDLQVSLNAGDTVYLEAYTDTDNAIVNIGMPTAMKLKVTENEAGEEVYTYRLSDYIENPTSHNRTVATRSTVMQTNAAWEFGYYGVKVTDEKVENDTWDTLPAAQCDPISAYTMSEGDDASQIINSLKAYEIIQGNKNYDYDALFSNVDKGNSVKFIARDQNDSSVGCFKLIGINADGKDTNKPAATDVENIIVTLGAANVQNAATYAVAVNAVMKFTAPVSGGAKLYLSDTDFELKNSGRYYKVLVLGEDGTVLRVYGGAGKDKYIKENDYFEKDFVQGESVYLAYVYDYERSQVTSGCNSRSFKIRNPYVEFTGSRSYITVNTDGGKAVAADFAGTAFNAGGIIELPAAVKTAAVFAGWKDAEGTVYAAGAEYEVKGNDALTAQWKYLGDIDGDGEIGKASDIALLRKSLFTNDNIDVADVNGSGSVDITDLIRLKKFATGSSYRLGW